MPSRFTKLFTAEGDLVLDPFVGSGTTAQAARLLGRHYLGIDISPESIELANQIRRCLALFAEGSGNREGTSRVSLEMVARLPNHYGTLD